MFSPKRKGDKRGFEYEACGQQDSRLGLTAILWITREVKGVRDSKKQR